MGALTAPPPFRPAPPAALFAALVLAAACAPAQAQRPPDAAGAPAPAPAAPAAAAAAEAPADRPTADATATPASYQAALAAMHAQDWPRARQLLQQTLDEQPDFAGAWLDLALVAWQQGEGAQAREFLDDLEDHFAPLPPAIAQAAQTLRQRLAAAAQPAAPGLIATDTAGYVALGLGHDSNANVGLRADAIRLTLPGGQVELPLAASSRQRAAAFAYAALQQAGAGTWQSQTLAWNWSLQTRQPSGIHGYSTVEAQGELGTPWALSSAPDASGASAPSPLVGLRWHSAWVGGQLAYVAPGVYASQRWASASPFGADAEPPHLCQWQQRAQLESRNYPRARSLASWGASYRLEWDCAAGPASASGWLGQAEAGWDAPRQHDRPGGHTWQVSLQLGRRIASPLGLPGHQLTLSAEWAHTQDTAGYSPWLEGGARRTVRRLGWQAHWLLPGAANAGTPGTGAWRWAVQLQGYRQSSNLPLFDLRSTAIQLLALRPW